MFNKEARARLIQKTTDRFIWTGERAVARKVDKRLAALQQAAQQKRRGFNYTPVGPNGDYTISSNREYILGKKVTESDDVVLQLVHHLNGAEEVDASNNLFVFHNRGKRRAKPTVEITKERQYHKNEFESWNEYTRRKRLEIMREYGLLPDPADLTLLIKQTELFSNS